jgi:hypothetical protein
LPLLLVFGDLSEDIPKWCPSFFTFSFLKQLSIFITKKTIRQQPPNGALHFYRHLLPLNIPSLFLL